MEPEYAYVIMDLVDGTNMYDIIKSSKKFPMFTKKFMKTCPLTLARSLDCIHRQGYLYNDIKPSNIMLNINTGDLIVVDLGSVIPSPKGSMLQHPLGTPYFFSPEKLTWNYDKPADIWALGITLYEFVCGQHPFLPPNLRDISELEYLIMEAPLKFSQESWNYYGEELQDLIKKMLHRDPEKRLTFPEMTKHPWIVNELPKT
jgi:serine/threonine protein kinase